MSDSPPCGLYVIAKDLAIAAKNAAAKLRLGAATPLLTWSTRDRPNSTRRALAPSTAIRRSLSPRSLRGQGEES